MTTQSYTLDTWSCMGIKRRSRARPSETYCQELLDVGSQSVKPKHYSQLGRLEKGFLQPVFGDEEICCSKVEPCYHVLEQQENF